MTEASRATRCKLFDFDEPDNNDWLAVNQFTVQEPTGAGTAARCRGLRQRNPAGGYRAEEPGGRRRDDLVGVQDSYRPTRTKSRRCLSSTSCSSSVTDWKLGSAPSRRKRDRFMPWRTIDGETIAPTGLPQLEIRAKGRLRSTLACSSTLSGTSPSSSQTARRRPRRSRATISFMRPAKRVTTTLSASQV